MSLVDTRSFHLPGNVPARKPLPSHQPIPQVHIHSDQAYPRQLQMDPNRQKALQSHSRTRTASSSIFPTTSESQSQSAYSGVPQNTNPVSYQAHMNQHAPTARRTPSNATTSTTSIGQIPNIPVRQNSGASLTRSTSSRSGSSPTSYVALMRKQKATVWSDRAQVCNSFV